MVELFAKPIIVVNVLMGFAFVLLYASCELHKGEAAHRKCAAYLAIY
jgi:hypothetical protein